MAQITLAKPITHDGRTWTAIEFDPSAGALEDFEEALGRGVGEIKAMIELMAADGDTPREVVRKLRLQDIQQAMEVAKGPGPLPSSPPAGPAGEPSAPMLHTS